MPEAEDHKDRNTNEQSGDTDIDEAGHVKGGLGDRGGVDRDDEEEDGGEMPELLDTDVEEREYLGQTHNAHRAA